MWEFPCLDKSKKKIRKEDTLLRCKAYFCRWTQDDPYPFPPNIATVSTWRKERENKLRETSEVAIFDALADLEKWGGGGCNPNYNRKHSLFSYVLIYFYPYISTVYTVLQYGLDILYLRCSLLRMYLTLRGLLVCIVNAEKEKKVLTKCT